MRIDTRPTLLGFLLTLYFVTLGSAWAQPARPLTEEALVQRIKAGLDDDEIVAQLAKKGIAFTVDAAVMERLKRAGATPAVLAALPKATVTRSAGGAVTYDAILKMLLTDQPEAEILKALEQAPTTFILSAEQEAELKKAGATDKLLAALQQGRAAVARAGSDVTALALILDCSGSMKELTKDQGTKMEAAKRALTEIIDGLADGLDVTHGKYIDAKDAAGVLKGVQEIAGTRIEAPAIRAHKSVVSAVIVTPLTLKGFPEIRDVYLHKSGERTLPNNIVQKTSKLGQPMVVSPGRYDVWYQPRPGRSVCLVRNLTVGEKETLTVQSNRVASAIVVNDLGIAGVKVRTIGVYPAGERATTNNDVQLVWDRFGQPMLVPADRAYDVLVTPQGGESVSVGKVQPKAGELTVIGGEGAAAPAKPE